MEKMEVVVSVLFSLLPLVRPSSAQSTQSTSYYEQFTTEIFLPSALFSPSPTPLSFFGEISKSSGTTFYTLFDEQETSTIANATMNFIPAQQYQQYSWNGYTFSACSTGTRYLLPNQNLTINCLFYTPSEAAVCTTTSLNLAQTALPSYATRAESCLYTATLGIANATAPPPRLTPAVKLAVGLSVPLAVCLCLLLFLLIYRHRAHKQLSRSKHMGFIVPSSAARVPFGGDAKLEPLVPLGEGGKVAFAAVRDGMVVSGLGGNDGGGGVGSGHDVRASEVSVFANELDGGWKVGRRELA